MEDLLMNKETTPGPWYAVFVSFGWRLHNKPTYQATDLLYAGNGNEETAEANAKLASQAPILKELVEKQEEYIKFLGDYLSGITGFLKVHGMECTDEEFEEGQRHREEIETLKSQL